MKTGKTVAIILAGGSGSRMGGPVKKQFALLAGRPLICHTLQTFQEYDGVDEIVLVTSAAGPSGGDMPEIEYVKKEIIEKYGFEKVKAVVPGGAERYHSVYAGLMACRSATRQHDALADSAAKGSSTQEATYVLIHDGARAFISKQVLDNIMAGLKKTDACVAAVPVKDTIKKADEECIVTQTLDRKELYAMQTPQAFSYDLVMSAYRRLIEEEQAGGEAASAHNKALVTDDAMVVEKYNPEQKILLTEGSYENIKVTTPDDLLYGEFLLGRRSETRP